MKEIILITWLLAFLVSCTGELLLNGGFESLSNWDCWNIQCSVSNDHHSGAHSVEARGRQHTYEGPSQMIHVTQGHVYLVSGWVKLVNDLGQGQHLQLEIDFTFPDGTHTYIPAADLPSVHVSNGWVHLTGTFTAPNKQISSTRFYYQGPAPGVNFLADDASVVEQTGGPSPTQTTNNVLETLRKSDIHVQVTAATGISLADVRIHVKQTKKSFPFGTAVNAGHYNDPAQTKYRDFIHQHFNWAVPEYSLKWTYIEPHRGQKNYQTSLDMINGLRSHGIKVRGHCLVWSRDDFVQDWVKQLYGNELRTTVQSHIQETMQKTHGLVEHWDVNNENLHGTWYQTRLNDPDYNIELFRIAHTQDPNVRLFLNDYNVVASGADTNRYLAMAQEFKAANVGLSGIGAQSHFGDETNPDPVAIKLRLDTLGQAGVPIWITELDVQAQDENKRADFYEHALRAMYGHEKVEGILWWGFWDQVHWRGMKAALVQGDNLQLTAAGRRVLDLLEREWMTDVTRQMSQGSQFTVRGFHGDYEIHVFYQNRELINLKKTFTLGKTAQTVNINVHL